MEQNAALHRQGLTSTQLKLIALICMTLDHTAKVIGQYGLMILVPKASLAATANVCAVLEAVGRLAFPLFAFLLSQSAAKTRSMPKFILRLTLFAVLSEPVFWYANYGYNQAFAVFWKHVSGLNLNNVFWTFVLAAGVIYTHQRLQRRNFRCWQLWFTLCFLAGVLTAEWIGCDYGGMGVMLVVGLYLCKTAPQKMAVVIAWSLLLYAFGQAFNGRGFNWWQVSVHSWLNCLMSMLSCVLIWWYNEQRGRGLKWLFYFYYPGHFMVLAVVRQLLYSKAA